jgi:hypothetical protein
MRSADQLVLLYLDDLIELVTELRRIYPEAVRSADDVLVGRASAVPVRTSSIADPTASAALDPRRRARHSNVKQSRKNVKAAVTALRQALAHATLAADSQ